MECIEPYSTTISCILSFELSSPDDCLNRSLSQIAILTSPVADSGDSSHSLLGMMRGLEWLIWKRGKALGAGLVRRVSYSPFAPARLTLTFRRVLFSGPLPCFDPHVQLPYFGLRPLSIPSQQRPHIFESTMSSIHDMSKLHDPEVTLPTFSSSTHMPPTRPMWSMWQKIR